MTYRKMAAFPVVWVALFALIALAVPADARHIVFRVENESSKALAMVGCFAAAYAFDRGDYLRRAWWLQACCYLLLLARDLLRQIVVDDVIVAGVSMDALSSAIVFVANVCAVFGTLLLARAWSIAGIQLPGSRAARLGVLGVAVAIALAITGSGLYIDLTAALHGRADAFTGVASDVGDVFSLALIAPVLLTAIAMRGGVLKWPWGLITTSMLFWLLYDAAAAVNPLVPGHADTIRFARETFRALACTYGLAGGLAQRRAITEPAPLPPPAG